ncbi:hypothetical protein DFH08DRAFT_963766 [Mycena albidolilacea]|uniref:Uncharacterized protein n=1 Tax=Mycena albidolilacea TaxID=1033008 RepID=A0AAD6ZTZ6_9AGAR|nr:hypothetical protein DFH08DRAFT_963766 [Mycena albidolilacea]
MFKLDLFTAKKPGFHNTQVTTDWYGRASKTLVSRLAKKITLNNGSLTSLHLVGMYTCAAVWTALLASGDGGGRGVRLTDLTTDDLAPDLCVPLLCAPPAYRWSFGAHPHCIDAICALQNLESLTMSVNAADVPHVVNPLLHTAVRLPSFASITIGGVISPSSKTRCGRFGAELRPRRCCEWETWYEFLPLKSSGEGVEGETGGMQRELLAYTMFRLGQRLAM